MVDSQRVGLIRLASLGMALAAFAWACPARAVLVDVEYYDRGAVNPEFAGGPLWTGVVDTTTDLLTIRTWQELPLHGNEFWIPQSLPMVWPARNSSGGLFDVPDTFDGRINDSFAFISDLTLRQMDWGAPVFDYVTTPPTLLSVEDAEFTLSSIEVRPGWGGFAFGPPNASLLQFTFLTANPFHTTSPDNSASQPKFDERIMPALPVQATAFTWSTEATVLASFAAATPVPEARLWAAIPAALGAWLGLVRLWRHRANLWCR
jgi:hypothetical protein